MKPLLKFAELIDKLNHNLGHLASWAVLIACVVSALNAFVRYGFDFSSNGFLEIQWYMFAYVVMFGTSVVYKHNEHVRVDVLYTRYSTKKQVWTDILGIIFFMLPVCTMMIYLSAPLFYKMLVTGEMSSNAGGLIRWPAMLALPLGFSLLFLQGVSELIKRFGWLNGSYNMSINYEKPLQ
jgi:TRAP-type mannitol/chloroaromatic compound transport system permease small subunit